MRTTTILFLLCVIFQTDALHAGLISAHTGSADGGNAQDPGIRLTTPSVGTSWNNLTFNFFHSGDGTDRALGNLFLLDALYAGTPQDLSSSTTGFLAEAAGNGSVYTFAPGVTLSSNTTYYFFADPGLPNGHSTFIAYSQGVSPGHQSYGSANGNTNFTARPFHIHYQLSGSAVPEPSSLLLVGLGVAGVLVQRKRRLDVLRP